MKTSELSIGDWVCAVGIKLKGEERLTPPMKVVTIGDDWVYLEIDSEQGDPFDEKIEDIRPVPLTVDMLIANGWLQAVHYQLTRSFKNDFEDPYMATISLVCDTLYLRLQTKKIAGEFVVDKVHELQRIMRLAGITEEFKLQ